MELQSNRELYEYLVGLGKILAAHNALDLSALVLAASRHVVAFPTTEFLGEARIALREVQTQERFLNGSERAQLLDVLSQLDRAFKKRT